MITLQKPGKILSKLETDEPPIHTTGKLLEKAILRIVQRHIEKVTH